METPLFETHDLCFGGFLAYPDLALADGRTTFVMGESGSGKSTLLKLCNATLSPSSGQILFRGVDVESWDALQLRRRVCLISQSVFLFDDTIRENFRLFYQYRDLTPPGDDVIRAFLDLCLIDLPVDNPCATLSGGERQRVYTALFLSFSPEVILLDEPTSALDALNSRALFQNLLSYCAENSISAVAVSHDRALAEEFAQEIVELPPGALRGERI